MGKALEGADMKLLQGDAHMAWMNDIAPINDGAEKIASSKDIGDARKVFEGLSKTMSNTAMSFKIQFKESAVIVHCPMAFKDRGANWMQLGDTVSNPYLGNRMKECGEVKMKLGQ